MCIRDSHGVDELNEGGEVLLLHRSLIVDIANERAVQQGFCFDPEIVSGLAFTFGVGDQRCDQLQDVLFAMDRFDEYASRYLCIICIFSLFTISYI